METDKDMIYLRQTSDEQMVRIPCTGRAPVGAMRLKLTGTVTLSDIYDAEVTDDGGSGLYWTFRIALPESASRGEYKYMLTDNSGRTIGSGLAILGEYAPQVEEIPIQVRFDDYDATKYEG